MPEVRPAATDRQALISEFSDFFDAVERGDREFIAAAIDRLCHPDVELLSGVSGRIEGKRRGREAVRAFFNEILDVWGELRYANREFGAFGDYAIVLRFQMQAQGRGSGVGLDQRAGAIWRMDGGLISSVVTYVDEDELESAANVIGVEAAFRTLADGGAEALLARYDEFFHEDFEWRPALIGGLDGRTYRGRAEFEQYWRDFTDAFEETDFGAPRVEAIGPTRILASGPIRVRGAGGGVPIEQEAGFVFDVRDGRVVAGRSFFSRAEAEEFARA